MTDLLIEELREIGLTLNAGKTKILHTHIEDEWHDIDFVEIGGDFVQVLYPGQVHRYLGRHLSFSASDRIEAELKYRRQQAWIAFVKHKKVILNKHVSLQKRLQYFDMCVSPAILFGLTTLPITRSRLRDLDILQRKMMRRIVGWRRIDGEDWEDTTRRM